MWGSWVFFWKFNPRHFFHKWVVNVQVFKFVWMCWLRSSRPLKTKTKNKTKMSYQLHCLDWHNSVYIPEVQKSTLIEPLSAYIPITKNLDIGCWTGSYATVVAVNLCRPPKEIFICGLTNTLDSKEHASVHCCQSLPHVSWNTWPLPQVSRNAWLLQIVHHRTA